MTHPPDLASAAEDPRLLPRWFFVGFGGLLALALVLVRVHILFLLIAGIGLLLGVFLAQRRGAFDVEEWVRSTLALRSPLPGTIAPALMALALAMVAAQVVAGSFIPVRFLPAWAIVVMAVVVGAVAAILLRRSELMRVAGIRGLESRDG